MKTLVAAAALTIVALAQPAEACSCKREPFPLDTGAEVPPNARLPVLMPLVSGVVTLVDASGAMVATESLASSSGSFSVAPLQPLTPGASYGITVGANQVTFTVGAVDDTTPPQPPELRTFERYVSPLVGRSTCDLGGENFQILFDNPSSDALIMEVFVGPSVSTIDLSAPAMVKMTRDGVLGFGDATLCTERFPTSRMSDLAVQVRAVDLAGNVSEFSNALQLKTGGCSATGGSALAVLAALLMARRRR